jgi:hypothetical protein
VIRAAIGAARDAVSSAAGHSHVALTIRSASKEIALSMTTQLEARRLRGSKHTCQNTDCGVRFYDLGRAEAKCPICATVFVPVPVPEPSQRYRRSSTWSRSPERAVAPVEPVIDEVVVDEASADTVELAAVDDGEEGALPVQEEDLDDDAEPLTEI